MLSQEELLHKPPLARAQYFFSSSLGISVAIALLVMIGGFAWVRHDQIRIKETQREAAVARAQLAAMVYQTNERISDILNAANDLRLLAKSLTDKDDAGKAELIANAVFSNVQQLKS